VADIAEPETGQFDCGGAEAAVPLERFWDKGRSCFGEAGEGDDTNGESSAMVGADSS